ncbi:Xylulose kinase [Limihaloglobus sulfuriphilus]|uniref:Xylulose kinase n=1 Tax=Limihaloglobus sulfuriphilus TaxID=1851148 RepID=A0A1Q2MDW3_9BACT|nr:FGGY family carbohydrate kinase [Limihaloglobus sulfuriphilus]AQQ70834.1 Xylulose kinase [Limihaloglobus sulfuriphilus]
MYILGFDLGTSSVKAVLLHAADGKPAAAATWPTKEMPIKSEKNGWAEQDPLEWWKNVKTVCQKVLYQACVDKKDIKAIGITYQMHGLVCVDKDLNPLRNSIIWCDSRAVQIGNTAFENIGSEKCLKRLLNSPGNFTASKLKWVKDNEPDIYSKIHKVMLPGDFIAAKMTGRPLTTISGLSEGILWDFSQKRPADFVMEHFGFSPEIFCEAVETFSLQGELTSQAAGELELSEGIPVTYRAGDQPNNALSLNVLNPGEIAATAGTSGVVYGVGSEPECDLKSRVNTFAHVNYTKKCPRYGVLLCVSGTGILNSWIRNNLCPGMDYHEMNKAARRIPTGSGGLIALPYGNGAERTLKNVSPGAMFANIDLNRHSLGHILRASQEGIVFAMTYGIKIMQETGLKVNTVRAGYANMFMSDVFTQTFAAVNDSTVELYETDGAQGACRGAGIGAGIYTFETAFTGLAARQTVEPDKKIIAPCRRAYSEWLEILQKIVSERR